MRISILTVFICFTFHNAQSQSFNDTINDDFVRKHITYLASDELRGRVNFTKEQLIAANYLRQEFINDSLKPYSSFADYFIPFVPGNQRFNFKTTLTWNGKELPKAQYLYYGSAMAHGKSVLDDYFILQASLPIAENLIVSNWNIPNRNVIIWIPTEDKKEFAKNVVDKLLQPEGGSPASDILIVGAPSPPESIELDRKKKSATNELYNVVGVMPGRSLPNEIIIFSAHYDHVNTGRNGESGLFNGANDNASGTTAVLALAKYFSMKNDNERTLLFCLFTGEELGLFGSKDFVNKIEPSSVKAVINIEMIGKTNRTGPNAFVVVGSRYSSIESILKTNLKKNKWGTKVKLEGPDPQSLFMRSDNYPFYLAGVPSVTIMCSDDDDPCYHRACDDAKSINISHMTKVIEAIADGTKTLIDGQVTPK